MRARLAGTGSNAGGFQTRERKEEEGGGDNADRWGCPGSERERERGKGSWAGFR
jgi:hypothetical protein